MKVVRLMQILVSLAVFLLFGNPRAYSQSEIDPDHFDPPKPAPVQQPKPSAGQVAHYDGKFKLPYAVQCNGKKLPPGNYSLSLHSSGSRGRVILKQKGQAIEIIGVLYKLAHEEASDALFVESKGGKRRLSAIRVAALHLVFDAEQQTEGSSDAQPIKIEKLHL